MNLTEKLQDGTLEQIYRHFSTEREVSIYLGISYSQLYQFFSKHPDIKRLSWLKHPSRLSLSWLKHQDSESINSFYRNEYHLLGWSLFEKKYSPTNLVSILSFLELRKGQRYYQDPYTRACYSSKVFINPLLVESDFKYWFLGYFLGDGTMMAGNRIEVYSTDKQVIDLLYTSFGVSPGSGYTTCDGIHSPKYIFHTADTTVRKLIESYKFTNNKSKLGWYGWNLIPEEYRPAFLRGLYESDGSYCIQSKCSSYVLSWVGHETYISSIASYLGVTAHPEGSVWRVRICKKSDLEFIKKMYPILEGLGTPDYPSNIRKANKALEVLHESTGTC